jgi:hypothetical protein
VTGPLPYDHVRTTDSSVANAERGSLETAANMGSMRTSGIDPNQGPKMAALLQSHTKKYRGRTMAKTDAISVRVPAHVKDALRREAQADHRSLASLVMKILVEWLRRRRALESDGSH